MAVAALSSEGYRRRNGGTDEREIAEMQCKTHVVPDPDRIAPQGRERGQSALHPKGEREDRAHCTPRERERTEMEREIEKCHFKILVVPYQDILEQRALRPTQIRSGGNPGANCK